MTIVKMLKIFILGILVYICQAKEKKKVWCDTNAIAKVREGNVTCFYPMNLRGGDNVVIRHYTDTTDNLIMDCMWDQMPDQCTFLRRGYKVTKVSGRALKLMVSNISIPHLSSYRCTLWNGTMYHSPFCAMLIHADTYAVSSGDQTSTPADPDQPRKSQDCEEGLSGGAVAGIVIGVLILVVLTTAVISVVCYSRWGVILSCCCNCVPGCLDRSRAKKGPEMELTKPATSDPSNEDSEKVLSPESPDGGQKRVENPAEANDEQSSLLVPDEQSNGYSSQSPPESSEPTVAGSGRGFPRDDGDVNTNMPTGSDVNTKMTTKSDVAGDDVTFPLKPIGPTDSLKRMKPTNVKELVSRYGDEGDHQDPASQNDSKRRL